MKRGQGKFSLDSLPGAVAYSPSMSRLDPPLPMSGKSLAEDKLIGRARIISTGAKRYRIEEIEPHPGKVYDLIHKEVLVDQTVGTEGKLVLRDTGFYISYHLIPDDS